MNKFLTKQSLFIMSIIAGAILILSLGINMILGVNYAVSADDHQTVTVQVNDYHFHNDLEDVQDVCETVFDNNDLKEVYSYNASMSANGELVYVFETTVDLGTVKTDLEAAFKTATAKGGTLDGAEVAVMTATEKVLVSIPASYAWRTVAAVATFAALTFVYVSIRYRLNMGVVAACSTIGGAALSAAVILLVRIPVTTAIFNVIAVSAMLSTVFTLLTFNKLRANLKSEEFADKSAEETVIASIACKDTLAIVAVLGVALVVVGAISRLNVFLFVLTSLLGLLAAAFVGLVFAPATYVPMLACAQKTAAETTKSGYVGAKKASDEEEA